MTQGIQSFFPPPRILRAVLASIMTLGTCAADGPKASDAPSPLLAEAQRQFSTMKSTLYQHKTQVDLEAGSYRYDCVGFVSYCLRKTTPKAWATVFKETGLAKGRIPSPPKYQAFFAGLAAKPQPGWQAIPKITDLKPGDIIAWEHHTKTAVGHAVILATSPVAHEEGSWKVEIFDSTASSHTDDSRRNDERAQPLPANGKRSGLGRGVMILIADPMTGALTGLRWSLRANAVTVPIAAGRPIS